MTSSRDRVLAAINHRQADRVPLDLGATAATGIHVNAYIRLRKSLGLAVDEVRITDVFGMMARVEMDLIEHVGVDAIMVPALAPRFGIAIDRWKQWRSICGARVHVPDGFETVEQDDGSLLLIVDGKAVGKMPRDGLYFSELANASMGEIDTLEDPPDPETVEFPLLTDEDLSFRRETARNLYETTNKALVVDVTDNIRWNTSIPGWLFAMATDPERVSELHDKKSRNLLHRIKQLAGAVGPYVQVFAIYQDYGTQRGEMISPALFERLVAPYYKRIFDWIHENTTWKVLFHSCGSIYNLIPIMIDMGVDILNPVQCNAARMEPKRLKAEFGDRLVFWGGGIDTQTLLPFGTPDEVRGQVQERIAVLGEGGGFVFAPSQDIQADVPAENLLAMYEAARG